MRKPQRKGRKGTRGNSNRGRRKPFTGHHIRQTSTEEREDGEEPDGTEEVEEDPRLMTI